jgi:hypothetical protein
VKVGGGIGRRRFGNNDLPQQRRHKKVTSLHGQGGGGGGGGRILPFCVCSWHAWLSTVLCCILSKLLFGSNKKKKSEKSKIEESVERVNVRSDERMLI